MDNTQLMDLRARVLRGEPVSDEELNAGLAAAMQMRASAPSSSPKATATTVKPINLAEKFAAFKAKKENPDASQS